MFNNNMRVLHIARNLLPHISGSTIRSRYIFKFQKKFATPFAFETNFMHKSHKSLELIDGIPYFRVEKRFKTLLSIFQRIIYLLGSFRLFFFLYINKIIKDLIIYPIINLNLKRLIDFYDIQLVHVHSENWISKHVLKICKKRNIPFVYEVRGFHELNLLAQKLDKKKSIIYKKYIILHLYFKYNLIIREENKALKKADLIFTLSKPMKKRISSRGISKQKIKIIPNCIDSKINYLKETNLELKKKLNLNESFIIGFIGRISPYEGLEFLIQSVTKMLKNNETDIKVLIIGSGPERYVKKLENLSKKLGIDKYILFLGQIPHSEIPKYYSIIDTIILPRINSKVCRIVTPIKPIEAMQHKTLVLASNLPALRFSIKPKETGDLFIPENSDDLAKKLNYYMKNPKIKKKIEEKAYEYVIKNFSWNNVIPKYEKYYNKLIN